MHNKKMQYWLLLGVGAILIIFGGLILKNVLSSHWRGGLIGIGAGIIGMSAANLITDWAIKRNPSFRRQIKAEEMDEHLVAIRNKAKSKVFDFNQFLAPSVFLVLILSDVNVRTLFLVLGAYLLSWAVYFWYLNRLAKDM